MACGQCSSGGCGNIVKGPEEKSNHKTVAGCSSGGCSSGGCTKMNSFDWLSNMDAPAAGRYHIVEIKFKGGRKEYFRNKNKLNLFTGDFVVCEMPTGYHIGTVSLQGELVRLQMIKKNIIDSNELPIIQRVATEKDLEKHTQAINRDLGTMYRTREICKELKLNLKLSEVEYQSDNSKATFYYSADDRVDFRELIKSLAGEFKVRIEMRQISLRQEAGRIGGIGSCGRELCCSTWLSDFKSIPTAAARYQNLSLNPVKLSGQCGRLKCCLNYELETYIDAVRDIPSVDKALQTEKGPATLQKTDIFRRLMWFSYPEDTNWYPVSCDVVKDIQKMNAEGKKPVALENLVELSNVEIAKPVSINNDLERLDKKYDTRSKNKKKPFNKNQGSGNNPNRPAQTNAVNSPQAPRPNPNQGTQGPRPQNSNSQQGSRPQNPNAQQGPRPQNSNAQEISRSQNPSQPQAPRPVNLDANQNTGANPNAQGDVNRNRNKKKKKFKNNNRSEGGNATSKPE